jgi:WD40 repeat protein
MTNKIEATVSPYAGLKVSCRHIAARTAMTERTHFVVGSAIVGKSNQLQVIEYDEMQATIQCLQTISHPDEIWWLACHPTDPDLLVSISQQSSTRTASATLFQLPLMELSSEHQQLDAVAVFALPDSNARRACYFPEDADKLVISCTNSLNLFDVSRPDSAIASVKFDLPLHSAAPDPLQKSSCVVAASSGPHVKLWDIRTSKCEYAIENAHNPDTLDVCFNPNKPYWICTGGSDGFLRCWDARVGTAAAEFRASSHWVTRAIPSNSHEQLILTTGTDSKVRVFNSEVFAFQKEGKLGDGAIIRSIRHDDSVYCATWATNNPWVFASVSYKGQVMISQLPSEVVDSILMGDDMD